MALISCPECGKEVSDKAKACPHCGYEINPEIKVEEDSKIAKKPKERKELSPKQKKVRKALIIGIPIAIVSLFCIYLFLSPRTFKWCCIHRKQGATCTAPITCLRCGKTWGSALGHEWAGATCTEPKKCKVCGATEGTAAGHKWTNATCTEPKKCKVCGATEGTAAGHKWANATCTTPKKCKVCGATTGSKLGHDVKDFICRRCKETVITRGEVKEVIDIIDPRYSVNSVGGIDQNMVFENKSKTKTINYITMEIEFYNAIGDVIKNDIGGKATALLSYTGPLGPGKKSSRQYWDACFYNKTYSGTMCFKEIKIEYSDGTVLILNENVANSAVKNWR